MKDKNISNSYSRIKITVLRRTLNEDFAKEYTKEKIELCPKNSEGQVYISIDGAKPEGFCDYAWRDIYKYIFALTFKGNFGMWMKNSKTVIACCTDGIRPVFYKIERVEG
jgi:uncharacterized repeat protein (TIGR04076 family)